MSESTASKDWIIFFISLAIMIALLIFLTGWFWLALPFVLTYLVKALNML